MLIIVVMKFTPKIDEAPAKCKVKIVRSILAPSRENFPDEGGKLYSYRQVV